MDEKLVPWILAGGAVIAGIFLFKSGTGNSTTTQFANIPQNTVDPAQAALQTHAADLIAMQINQDAAAQAAFNLQRERDNATIEAGRINASTTKANIQAAESAAKNRNVFGFLTAFVQTAGMDFAKYYGTP